MRNDTFSISTGSILRAIRKAKKITMKSAAAKADIRENTLRKYEFDQLNPKKTTRNELARALDTEPALLHADWEMTKAEAIAQLFALFELCGGRFVRCDGKTALLFEKISPVIEDWEKIHSAAHMEYASAQTDRDRTEALQYYFDYMEHFTDTQAFADAEECSYSFHNRHPSMHEFVYDIQYAEAIYRDMINQAKLREMITHRVPFGIEDELPDTD